MKLTDLLKQTAAYLASKTKEAVTWYRNRISSNKKAPSSSDGGSPPILDAGFKKTSIPEIGKMYNFRYYPHYADEQPFLPFWDENPLIVCLSPNIKLKYGPGFLGLNMHYLPPAGRAILLQALLDLLNNVKYDDSTRLLISYNILKNSTKYPGYENCVKKYYYKNKLSELDEIPPTDWEKIVLLPSQIWRINPKKPGKPPY